jgi:hypothetical protein
MLLKCIKCGHVNQAAKGTDDEACPQCGAIYSKASSTASRPVTRTATPSILPPLTTPHIEDAGQHARDYVGEMRGRSLYPAFRAVAELGYWIGIVAAVLIFFAGVGLMITKSFFQGIAVVGLAAFVLLFAKAVREASLMLADLSDAAVRMAQQGRR